MNATKWVAPKSGATCREIHRALAAYRPQGDSTAAARANSRLAEKIGKDTPTALAITEGGELTDYDLSRIEANR